ncbi:MAG: hypothetical protein ABSG42_08665 [Nitrospirota bacterium]
MFYKQGGMFVAYMKRQGEAKFRTFMLSIEDGRNFGDSFKAAYGMGIGKSWEMFRGQLTISSQN